MFRNSKIKKVLITTLALIIVFGTVVIAAENIYTKDITATFGRIKFNVDGKDVTRQIESKYGTPAFVADDRSYVPVRAIAELMGLDIDYDDNTHTVEITDVKSDKYEAELKKKDAEITKLKKEIADLKKKANEETKLEALEKELNKDYGTYKNVNFAISLKETSSSIDTTITVDLRTSSQKSNWNKLNNTHKKDYVEELVDDIAREFKNTKIAGSIYDNADSKDLLTFNKNKNSNTVTISHKGTTSPRGSKYYGYDYLDRVVEDVFYDEHIDDAYISDFYTTNTIVEIEITFSDRYDREWDDLRDRDIENMLDEIAREIEYDYRDRDVYIDVYMDGYREGSYTKNYDESYGTFKLR